MYFVKAVYKSDKGKIPKHYKKDSRELKGFTLSNPLFLELQSISMLNHADFQIRHIPHSYLC